MQHCTKVPLLLHNIGRYTLDPVEQQMLTESLRTLETSLGPSPLRVAMRQLLYPVELSKYYPSENLRPITTLGHIIKGSDLLIELVCDILY